MEASCYLLFTIIYTDIASTFTLETLCRDPFDYRLEVGFKRLPVAYDATLESHQGRPKR